MNLIRTYDALAITNIPIISYQCYYHHIKNYTSVNGGRVSAYNPAPLARDPAVTKYGKLTLNKMSRESFLDGMNG